MTRPEKEEREGRGGGGGGGGGESEVCLFEANASPQGGQGVLRSWYRTTCILRAAVDKSFSNLDPAMAAYAQELLADVTKKIKDDEGV